MLLASRAKHGLSERTGGVSECRKGGWGASAWAHGFWERRTWKEKTPSAGFSRRKASLSSLPGVLNTTAYCELDLQANSWPLRGLTEDETDRGHGGLPTCTVAFTRGGTNGSYDHDGKSGRARWTVHRLIRGYRQQDCAPHSGRRPRSRRACVPKPPMKRSSIPSPLTSPTAVPQFRPAVSLGRTSAVTSVKCPVPSLA